MAPISRNKRQSSSGGFIFMALVVLVMMSLLVFAWISLLQTLLLTTSTPTLVVSAGAKIEASVRGNLGPPEVMLRDGEDWLKDRWQAASDMHGTAIKGQHWVELTFASPVSITSIVLDWETAYADDYELIGISHNNQTKTFFDSRINADQRSSRSWGQSPGVKQKLPLHIEHTIQLREAVTINRMRLLIRKSVHGWGVSLWKISVMGHKVQSRLFKSHS